MSEPLFRWEDSEAQALLQKAGEAGQNTRPLQDALAFALTERARLSFNDERDPWGEAWAPLSPVTLAKRRDEGRSGASILRDTGALLASLTADIAGQTTDIRIGFADRPATIHMFGGQAGRAHKTRIPARPSLPIRKGGEVDMPPAWRDDCIHAMTAHIVGAFS